MRNNIYLKLLCFYYSISNKVRFILIALASTNK